MGTDIHAIFQAKKNDQWYDIPHNYEADRHYSLFAWLADVRQGNTYIKPISPARGLPADFKVEDQEHPTSIENIEKSLQDFYTEKYPYDGLYNMGYHNYSWLLGSEILANIPKHVAKQGIIPIAAYKAWDNVSPPEMYCAAMSGGNTHIVTPDVIDYYAKTATHVHVCWVANLEQEFKYFTDEIRRLMEIHGEIRMVFGFDS